MITLYGIPNCDTVKKARTWLEKHNQDYVFFDVRKDVIATSTIEGWCERADWQMLVNKRSTTWKQLDEQQRQSLSRDNVATLLADHPTLIKRPVLDHNKGLEVGFDDSIYHTIFSA